MRRRLRYIPRARANAVGQYGSNSWPPTDALSSSSLEVRLAANTRASIARAANDVLEPAASLSGPQHQVQEP